MLLIVLEGEGEVVSGDRQEAAHPGTVIFCVFRGNPNTIPG
jgi:ethanolamine utilization protein EutQ (cupin superfamily)